VKIHRDLLCYIKTHEELDGILKQEAPVYDNWTDLIERHQDDHIQFDGEGVYPVNYLVQNPCWHGFWVEKQDKDKILKLYKVIEDVVRDIKEYENRDTPSVSARG